MTSDKMENMKIQEDQWNKGISGLWIPRTSRK
jgi:hypothetical protein